MDTITKETVALKKLRMISETDGFPISAIRELKFLRQLQHPNIIHLRDIVPVSKRALDFKELFMVFDYIPFDLSGLIESGIINWNEAKINSIFVQIMRGVARCHEDDIMHRDIKCANILVTKQ